MGMDKLSIRAIAFDFGNTLCPWDEPQYWDVTRGTIARLCAVSGIDNHDTAMAVFGRLQVAKYAESLPRMREVDLVGSLTETAKTLSGRVLSDDELADVMAAHLAAFVGVCKTPAGLPDLLERLKQRYELAVLSNYSVSDCIREALKAMGIAGHFPTTMVSADLGIIKPSRKLFGELLSRLGLEPSEVLFVGDDWVADIVGACASGLPCVHVENNGAVHGGRTKNNPFSEYLSKALESPELSCWQEAKPLAVMKTVLELEHWLEEQGI